jgi:hypothetical protein
MCVMPSRYGVFSEQRTWPDELSTRRSTATGGQHREDRPPAPLAGAASSAA